MKKETQKLIVSCLTLCLFILCAGSLAAQTGSQKNTNHDTTKTEKMKTIKIQVKGMSCQEGCADGLDAKFKNVEGVVASTTTFDNSTSEIKQSRFNLFFIPANVSYSIGISTNWNLVNNEKAGLI